MCQFDELGEPFFIKKGVWTAKLLLRCYQNYLEWIVDDLLAIVARRFHPVDERVGALVAGLYKGHSQTAKRLLSTEWLLYLLAV